MKSEHKKKEEICELAFKNKSVGLSHTAYVRGNFNSKSVAMFWPQHATAAAQLPTAAVWCT